MGLCETPRVDRGSPDEKSPLETRLSLVISSAFARLNQQVDPTRNELEERDITFKNKLYGTILSENHYNHWDCNLMFLESGLRRKRDYLSFDFQWQETPKGKFTALWLKSEEETTDKLPTYFLFALKTNEKGVTQAHFFAVQIYRTGEETKYEYRYGWHPVMYNLSDEAGAEALGQDVTYKRGLQLLEKIARIAPSRDKNPNRFSHHNHKYGIWSDPQDSLLSAQYFIEHLPVGKSIGVPVLIIPDETGVFRQTYRQITIDVPPDMAVMMIPEFLEVYDQTLPKERKTYGFNELDVPVQEKVDTPEELLEALALGVKKCLQQTRENKAVVVVVPETVDTDALAELVARDLNYQVLDSNDFCHLVRKPSINQQKLGMVVRGYSKEYTNEIAQEIGDLPNFSFTEKRLQQLW